MFKTILQKYHVKRQFLITSLKYSSQIPEAPKQTLLNSLLNLVNYERAYKFHHYVDGNHKKLGPIYRDKIGPVSAVFLNSPEDYQKIFRYEGATPRHFLPEAWLLYNDMRKCQRGLLFMDGEEWQYYRKIINKIMVSPYSLKDVVIKSSFAAADDLSKELKIYSDNQQVIPAIERRLYRWSIEVMMSVLMGSTWNSYKQIGRIEAEKLAGILHKVFEISAKLSLLPAKYAMKLRLPVWQEFVKVADETLDLTRKLVPQMESYGGDGLLFLMKQEGIQDDNLIKIVTDLILAAGDTTAYSTQWALFLLSTHQNIQDEFAKQVSTLEVNEIIGNSYAKGILKESLRLYPTKKNICGYDLSGGELILMSLYSSGRNPLNFYQPNEFIPSRWLRNEKGNFDGVHNSYGSLPFALGVRSCVGKKLAETQMTLLLSQLVKNYKINCSNATKIDIKLHLISVPSEPILFYLTKR
ncbi:hypothetical protein HCN44_007393 [Aphidius gifuensis]|uniref:Cytochrome P450 n=1 Tax=Aphidius gifuensis TaxID=684658 RepID=A0A834XKV8_APHGI|nr:hypothetical protein HCN44_007393 [Aphidius gifuensis]